MIRIAEEGERLEAWRHAAAVAQSEFARSGGGPALGRLGDAIRRSRGRPGSALCWFRRRCGRGGKRGRIWCV